MKDAHENILDAFLEEALTDARPGRSAEDIARYVNERLERPAEDASTDEVPLAAIADAATSPMHTAPADAVSLPQAEDAATTRGSRDWVSILSMAVVLMVAAALTIWLLSGGQQDGPDDIPNLVEQSPPVTTPRDDDQPEQFTPDPDGDMARNTVDPSRDNRPRKQAPGDSQIVRRDDVPEDQTRLVLPAAYVRTVSVDAEPLSSEAMSEEIDEDLIAAWQQDNYTPAQMLELRNWANRLGSRALGRAPQADEMEEINDLLAQSKSPELIRDDLIDHFFEDPEFRAEFDRYWGQMLAWNLLGISPSMQATDADMLRVRDWLTNRIANNDPLDTLAYDLISAVGSTATEAEDFNPAASYMVALLKRFSASRELASSHVSSAFLGRETQCAQCHNSYSENQLVTDFTQQDFYEFHSFFAQLRFEPLESGSDGQYFVVNRNYLPLADEQNVDAPIVFTAGDGQPGEAYPEFDEFELGPNGFVEKVDRRTELARMIAGSPLFRETIVDFVWGCMLNVPLSGIDGNADPDMLQIRSELATQFAANDFDLQWLVETIASTDAFAVGVGTEEQLAANNPFLGEAPQFNIFYHRLENQRSAIGSLGIVAQAYRSGEVEEALSAGLLARVEGQTEMEPQTILPFVPSNDNQWATTPRVARQLDAIAASNMSRTQKVEHLVLAALGRSARPEEIEQANIILDNSDDERTALQDVWWCLLNSVEYYLPLGVR
ncbi:MAG: DUF1549 domain-containing protein [Pirellulaceae bacterium]